MLSKTDNNCNDFEVFKEKTQNFDQPWSVQLNTLHVHIAHSRWIAMQKELWVPLWPPKEIGYKAQKHSKSQKIIF